MVACVYAEVDAFLECVACFLDEDLLSGDGHFEACFLVLRGGWLHYFELHFCAAYILECLLKLCYFLLDEFL